LQLGSPHVRRSMQDLALKIAEVDDVEIHDADSADPSGRQIQPQRRSQASSADEQNTRCFKALLPVHPHFWHDEMPAIAGHFLGSQIQTLGSGSKWIGGNWHDRLIEP